jgi:hypothetical protein
MFAIAAVLVLIYGAYFATRDWPPTLQDVLEILGCLVVVGALLTIAVAGDIDDFPEDE